jgi:molybdopterin-containing oxidoreductase family membrane subunit
MQEGVNVFYFVIGAIVSASALALTFVIPARAIFRWHAAITDRSIGSVCWILLLSGTVVGYAYCMELFMVYYSSSRYEGDAFLVRAAMGPSVWLYWLTFFCNVFAPQFLWFKRVRANAWAVFAVAIAVDFGVLYDRYVTLATTWAHGAR